MVLDLDFRCRNGVLRLTVALALGSRERAHAIGCTSPHVLVRHSEVPEDEVEVELELAPRREHGLSRRSSRSPRRPVRRPSAVQIG
jgi:hypothetical protein